MKLLKKHYGSAGEMNHNIHVSLPEQFIYVTNPKVACSSTKATLNLAHAAANGIAHDIPSMAAVHARQDNPLPSPSKVGVEVFEKMLADPAVCRFTFTREPVGRFFSAYLSKLAPGKRNSGMAKRLWAHMGWEKDYPLTIEEFGEMCATDSAIRDFDPHWRLQRDQIAWGLIDYTFIGDHARFGADFSALLQRLFGQEVEIFDTRAAFNRFTKAGSSSREVSPGLLKNIQSAYAADFEMLSEIEARGLNRLPD